VISAQDCGSNFDIKKLRQTNPEGYREHLRVEKIISDYRQRMTVNPNARLIDENGTITIPIVFHVMHRGEPVGTGTNISDALLVDQVAVLNECFSQTNNDQNLIAPPYQGLPGNPNFRFEIACTDPNGAGTTGIVRRQSTTVFSEDSDNIKTTSTGGDDPWPTDRFLNVWIAPNNLNTGTSFGYSPWAFLYSQNPNKDGVVVRFDAVGRNLGNFTGRASGRTMVHEIGHWLNLFHLFDGGCQGNDFCNDTPSQNSRTSETATCPITTTSCGNTNVDMFDNFMDGTNETCGRRMFTRDQVIRMRAVFQPGRPRRGFIDNYFTLARLYSDCTLGYYLVRTPFCAANQNISWSITGPATTSGYPSTFATVYPQAGANGIAVLTASWNNNAADISIPVGYGTETSYYNFYYPFSNYGNLRSYGVHYITYNSDTYGQLSFSNATGPAQNWQLLTSSSQAYFSGSGNSFSIRLTQPYAFARVRATVPTACGDRTVEYSFYGAYGTSYALSPNPAANEITISASALSGDPNSRTSNTTMAEYEVQIFNSFNQLLKKTKSGRGNSEVTIDVSRFPSNQFYTVKLISDTDVQTKSFFKQ
jgi:Pregnancy-associated plasma protein-A/Secretion system C-terminal sorting domain